MGEIIFSIVFSNFTTNYVLFNLDIFHSYKRSITNKIASSVSFDWHFVHKKEAMEQDTTFDKIKDNEFSFFMARLNRCDILWFKDYLNVVKRYYKIT